MGLTYVVDFDDLCDNVADRALAQLAEVKEKHPKFKCTLFTIPDRTSDETIAKFKATGYTALAPHGHRHTRGECLTWPYHEAKAKIEQARARGITSPAFRAPAWLINRATYEVCRDLGITVCDHKDQYLKVEGSNVYRYNDPAFRKPKIRPIHGHLTDCAVDNYIGDMLSDGRLSFAKTGNFLYCYEASKFITESDDADVSQL